MSGKILGAALLVISDVMICWSWIKEKRSQIYLAKELSAALERMEGMVRWQNLPIKRVLEAESNRKPCGAYFMHIKNQMQSGLTLQAAWTREFSTIKDNEMKDILCRMDLQGDAQQVIGTMRLTAKELRKCAADMSLHQQERERLCMAASGCLTAVLVIVLI